HRRDRRHARRGVERYARGRERVDGAGPRRGRERCARGVAVTPAVEARAVRDVRLLVVDPSTGALGDRRPDDLVSLLAPGDVLVLNDAATLPASLRGVAPDGAALELRLAGTSPGGFRAVLFGTGDWRQRTEDRPPPPVVPTGASIQLEGGL